MKDVAERGVRIDCPLTAAKAPSVCHPLPEYMCVSEPVMQPICGDKVTWLIKRGVGAVERGRTLAAQEDLTSMCSCFGRERGQA